MTLQQLVYIISSPVYYLLNLPLDLFKVTGRLRKVSPATLIAVLLFLFLVTLEVTAFICATLRTDAANPRIWLIERWQITLGLIALPIVIPIVVRLAILYWLEPDSSPYPDIEQAWNAGLASLKEHNIALNQTPLFLVVGLRDEQAAEMLMTAAARSWVVKGVPGGSPPIQFYATPDAVYLCCIDCAQSSRLSNADPVSISAPGPARMAEMTLSPEFNAGRGSATFDASRAGGEGSLFGNSLSGSGITSGSSSKSILEDSSVVRQGYKGTLDGFGPSPSMDIAAFRTTRGPSSAMATLTPDIAEKQSNRLAYVCKLIRRARDPYCPINGILSVLPYKLIQLSDNQANELARAVKADLESFRKHLSLRCSVIGLMTGLEQEPGFCELKRRLGKTASRENRFGKGFRRMWVPAAAESVEALTAHACQQFESWTYHLFKQENALQKIGNAKLYALLCKVRTQLRQRMVDTISKAFAYEPSRERAEAGDKMLFGGLYFGASGEKEDLHGFVKGVFDKLVQREDIVEWTPDIVASDKRFFYWAQISTAVFWLMLLATAGMSYFIFTGGE